MDKLVVWCIATIIDLKLLELSLDYTPATRPRRIELAGGYVEGTAPLSENIPSDIIKQTAQ